jgi:uncharacterized protein
MWLHWLVAANSLIKAIAFLLVWVIIWLPLATFLLWLLKLHIVNTSKTNPKLPLLASLYSIAPLVVWGAAEIEDVSFSDYGINLQPTIFVSLAAGIGLAMGGLVILFGLEFLLGSIKYHWQNQQRLWSILFPILGLSLWVGFVEELIFRGFLINELQQDYTPKVAAAISSIIFALLHLIWERKTTIPQLPGLWLMGMVLVAARWADNGSLGLAWGLHAGWILGFSCLDSAELISYTGKTPAWITGIEKQPLAGVAGILCLLATGVGCGAFSVISNQ